ncbi:hypothetical protein INT45_012182 [Circinella minor]|uniref:CxC2-like cysteine cluster KDZ transposase-associated domain-containing protein n=1 Tax=Circinella minor TaxID=1195481 RepID=A0A8H7RHL4_9FUNG|nr:hypothetical protein INT45_012182 [Circinella minor]
MALTYKAASFKRKRSGSREAQMSGRGKRRMGKQRNPTDQSDKYMLADIIPTEPVSAMNSRSHTNSSTRNLPGATSRAIVWTTLLPSLVKAYVEGYGIQEPKSEELAPVPGPICSCMDKSSHTVTCIFKCGIANYNIVYCKKCPEYCLPLVLARSHLFLITPEVPGIAIHVKQMFSLNNMFYKCGISVHKIAQWAKDEYEQKAPASLKGRLNEALPVYNMVVLSVKKELREKSGVILGCTGCRFIPGPKPIAMDSNFQHHRFARNKDPEGVVYPGDDGENSRYWSIVPDEAIHYPGSASDGCETFNALQKQGGQSKKIDQTGIFGCACSRHGYPVSLVDIFSYVLTGLLKVINNQSYGSNIMLQYDVGYAPIAVGVWHTTGHKPSCQIKYHPRLVKHFGLTDGETLERMWSFLSSMINMCRNMSSMNRRLTLTLALDAYAAQRMNNIGSLIQCKHKRAVDMLDHAILSLNNAGYMGNLPALEESWNRHVENIEGRFSNATAHVKRVTDAKERLRVAVGIFDIIDQAFKNGSNGNNCTQNLAAQKETAYKQKKKLDIYNKIATQSTVIGFCGSYGDDVKAIIALHSDFQNDCNMLTTMDSNAPYDAYHGLQRAIEEFAMLKDEAASVIKHGKKDIVNKLEAVVNGPSPNDIQGRGMIVMWEKQLKEGRRWAASQEEKLAGIADGSKIPVIFSAEENGDEEEGDESDEEEETNYAEFINLFPEDMVVEDD